MLSLVLLLGCGASNTTPVSDPAPPEAPVARDEGLPDAPPMLRPFTQVRLRGLCEPSGAVAGAPGLWIGEDDGLDYLLTTSHTPSEGMDVQRVSLTLNGAPLVLDDIEGAARIGDEVWWTTSISRSRPGRTTLAWMDALGGDAAGAVDLVSWREEGALEGWVRAVADCDLPDDLHTKGPKRGGLDIEGLAAGTDHLYLGLRGPLTVDHRALVVQVDRERAKAGDPAGSLITAAWCLDLGARGVRSLTADPRKDGAFLGIAGLVESGGDFDLFAWTPGQAPRILGRIPTPEHTSPEALVVWMDEGALAGRILFDEGTRTERDTGCACADVLAGSCEGHPADEAYVRVGSFSL